MFTKGKWILLLYIFWQLYRSYLHHFCSTDRGTSKRFQVRHSSQCKTTKHQSFHPSFHAPDSHLQPWSSAKWNMVSLISICFKSLSEKGTTSFTVTWWTYNFVHYHLNSPFGLLKNMLFNIALPFKRSLCGKILHNNYWRPFLLNNIFLNVWNDFDRTSHWK